MTSREFYSREHPFREAGFDQAISILARDRCQPEAPATIEPQEEDLQSEPRCEVKRATLGSDIDVSAFWPPTVPRAMAPDSARAVKCQSDHWPETLAGCPKALWQEKGLDFSRCSRIDAPCDAFLSVDPGCSQTKRLCRGRDDLNPPVRSDLLHHGCAPGLRHDRLRKVRCWRPDASGANSHMQVDLKVATSGIFG